MKIESYIKSAEYLYPDPDIRKNLMKRIENNFKLNTDTMDDPFQRKLIEV